MTEIRSDIAWSTSDRVVVRGRDLSAEVLGRMNLGEFAYMQLMGEPPSQGHARLFNAILVTLVEHGLTPSVLAARLTYLGAPESLQAAVAAGLCGVGSVFVGSTEGAAKMLSDALEGTDPGADLQAIAVATVDAAIDRKSQIPGIGHPIHKPIDPRVPRLFEIARDERVEGRYIELMELISDEASRQLERDLPINATGAIGAIACELGLPIRVIRGFGVMARAIGIVGHLLEESERPIAAEIWTRADREGSAHVRAEQAPEVERRVGTP